MVGVVTALHIHPVKSCRAVALERVEVTRRGLAGDRLFQVVDAEGTPVTQRQHPELATVSATLMADGLRLDADGHGTVEFAVPTVNDVDVSSLLGAPVAAADAGDDAARFFTELLAAPVRLVGATEASENRVPFPGGVMDLGWADGSTVVIANDASHRWLAHRSSEPFGMDRFRPNVTVDADAWDEDTWRDVSIGGARFGVGLAWPRCAIPQVDQTDGSRHREPAKVLRAHRWCTHAASVPEPLRPVLEGNALFGIGCSVEQLGSIATGDEVLVRETGPRVIDVP